MWRLTSSSRRNMKAEARPPLSPRSTLNEVLRINQFRIKNASPPALVDEKVEKRDEAGALNKDLTVLANVFSDVQYDCLRQLLKKFDGDSRLEICTEQLYRYKNEWTKGSAQLPPREQDELIPVEEQFRTEQYKSASARLLYKEFTSLSKSTIDGVLAEVNNSYMKARPKVQAIANKLWRMTIVSWFRRKKDRDVIPTLLWERGRVGQDLAPSGCKELDEELESLFLRPLREELAILRDEQDRIVAQKLNEGEAESVGALYECQICYNDVPFESISACTAEMHLVCLDCVRKSLNEAIFGQNWAQSVEPGLSTLKCLAPAEPRCHGYIPASRLKQAILIDRSGTDLWNRFQDRLADKAVFEAKLQLARCPYCSYAEEDATHTMQTINEHVIWSFRQIPPHYTILMILVCALILPTLFFVCVICHLISPALLPGLFYTAIVHLAAAERTTRFKCQNPNCKRNSCLKCHKAWHDPHSCHEPLLLSLRQSVEAARTNAVKRVCPRCGTAFVKSSGCNKLTCVCGYSMCYLCRKNIGKTGENEGAEGYRHFCEHFRPVPGTKCSQCDKCDLYKNEEEDVLVRNAGEEAEREWRQKQKADTEGGNSGEIDGIRINHDLLVGRIGNWERFVRGDWTLQGMVDDIVGSIIIVKLK